MPTVQIEDPNGHLVGTGQQHLDFLRALTLLAQATAPAPGSRYQTNSMWAVAKYAHVYDPRIRVPPNNDLYINPGIADLDPHQKTILSDDMGVAIALGLLDGLHGIVGAADVFQLVSQGVIALRRSGRHRKMPDYLVTLARPLNGFSTILLECKGSQTRDAHVRQLDTACRRQLGNVANVTGQPVNLPRLAIASQLLRGQAVTVHVDDPPLVINGPHDLELLLKRNWLALQYSMFQDTDAADELWTEAGLKSWGMTPQARQMPARKLGDWSESTLVSFRKIPKRYWPRDVSPEQARFLDRAMVSKMTVRIRPSADARRVARNRKWDSAIKDYRFRRAASNEKMIDADTTIRRTITDKTETHTKIKAELKVEMWA